MCCGFSAGKSQVLWMLLKKERSSYSLLEDPQHLELFRSKPTAPGQHLEDLRIRMTQLRGYSVWLVRAAHCRLESAGGTSQFMAGLAWRTAK